MRKLAHPGTHLLRRRVSFHAHIIAFPPTSTVQSHIIAFPPTSTVQHHIISRAYKVRLGRQQQRPDPHSPGSRAPLALRPLLRTPALFPWLQLCCQFSFNDSVSRASVLVRNMFPSPLVFQFISSQACSRLGLFPAIPNRKHSLNDEISRTRPPSHHTCPCTSRHIDSCYSACVCQCG